MYLSQTHPELVSFESLFHVLSEMTGGKNGSGHISLKMATKLKRKQFKEYVILPKKTNFLIKWWIYYFISDVKTKIGSLFKKNNHKK